MTFDEQADRLGNSLPAGPTIVVIGSTSCHHPGSPVLCGAAGRELAAIPDLTLITGGVPGVGEGVGRAFFGARAESGRDSSVVHVLPRGSQAWDYGVTLFAGSDMRERREILARLSSLYLAIEGGPGTAHEASVALERNAWVIPVGSSGGCAGSLFSTLARPPKVPESVWRVLGSPDAGPVDVAAVVGEIVRRVLGN